ncbi:MAG: MFS transporter, partial [Dehalococcoidia bacterium]|nr:MFS transporter [Dehalococcoidia bacterium]
LVAAISSAIAFGAMGFIMSATPLSMHVIDRFSLNSTTIVIQSHIIGMYLPSLFSGFLVERLGVKTLQILGVAGMCVAAVAAAASHQFVFYLVALTFLGIGWNFLFVAGTVMLTHSYRSVERFKAQGINDFAVFTFQALAILSAGLVLSAAGWEVLNLVTIPFLLITLVMVITTRSAAKKQTGF